MAWKYIVFESKVNGETTRSPVIFPDNLVHSEVANHLKLLMPGWHYDRVIAHSAGMICSVEVTGIHGESETLNTSPDLPDDLNLINLFHRHKGKEPKNNGR